MSYSLLLNSSFLPLRIVQGESKVIDIKLYDIATLLFRPILNGPTSTSVFFQLKNDSWVSKPAAFVSSTTVRVTLTPTDTASLKHGSQPVEVFVTDTTTDVAQAIPGIFVVERLSA